MEAVIIYRSSWEARKSIPFFSAVDCNNSSPSQSTNTLRSDFLFSFSLIDPEALLSVSAVHLSVSCPSVRLHGHFFASFHVIRDLFLIISHHSWCIFAHFYIIFFLVALPPLSIYNFTSNNHSFFSHLFQVWLYQLCKRDYSSYLDVLGLTITNALLSHFNQSLIASRKVIDSVRR